MTNLEIIASNMMDLIQRGVISENNTINTVIGWNMRGYKIKKGEKHIAEFPIWSKNKNKKRPEPEEAEEEGKEKKKYNPFILTNAYWFTDQQVEPLTKEDKIKKGGKRA